MQTDMNVLARLGAQLRIAELFAEIEALIDAFPGLGQAPSPFAAPPELQQHVVRRRRRMSDVTKAKLRASWAKRRAAVASKTVSPSASEPTSAAGQLQAGTAARRRVLSPAARARIVTAQKKRWAAFRKKNKKR